MTLVVWLLVGVVAMLATLVVGLLRSHAVIVRALHDAGINMDPDKSDVKPASVDLTDKPPISLDTPAQNSPELRPTTEIFTDTHPDIRTIDGVPEPADATGRRAADLIGLTPSGSSRAISVHGRGATLVAFLTTGCATCAGFWNAFADGVQLPADVRLVIVTKGGNEESPADVAAMAPPGIVTISSSQAWDDYQIPVAPYFVLVDGKRGVVAGEGAASSWDLVSELLERALADAGYSEGQVRRRDMLLGRNRANRVDQELLKAGIAPGDPRLYHEPASLDS
jgi:hypothetical protein